jgi:hypothetical protein
LALALVDDQVDVVAKFLLLLVAEHDERGAISQTGDTELAWRPQQMLCDSELGILAELDRARAVVFQKATVAAKQYRILGSSVDSNTCRCRWFSEGTHCGKVFM